MVYRALNWCFLTLWYILIEKYPLLSIQVKIFFTWTITETTLVSRPADHFWCLQWACFVPASQTQVQRCQWCNMIVCFSKTEVWTPFRNEPHFFKWEIKRWWLNHLWIEECVGCMVGVCLVFRELLLLNSCVILGKLSHFPSRIKWRDLMPISHGCHRH